MNKNKWVRFGLLGAIGLLMLNTPGAVSQRTSRFVPRFEALAETSLLMEGLAHSNFRGVDRLLKEPPTDVDTWKFVRGQALFIGETGNLLLLRPPRGNGRDPWMKRAMEMRDAAGALATQAGKQDYARSRLALNALANACNRCHQTFRETTRIRPSPPTAGTP